MHQWLALTDNSPINYGKITGYLKVSLQITGNKDTIIPIKEEVHIESQGPNNLLIPTTVQPEYI